MSARFTDCWQINLQEGFGGGEVYTRFLTRALQKLGVRSHIIVARRAGHWRQLLPAETELIAVGALNEIPECLPPARTWVVSHGGLNPDLAHELAAKHVLTAIAHMPPQGRKDNEYKHFDLVFGVSSYVLDGLRDLGVPVWGTPMYGVADLHRGDNSVPIRESSCYDWDRRKGRDRLLSWIEPMVEPWHKRPLFARQPGVNLGIVSRLTPIKQFPLLFEKLAPVLASQPDFNLDVFGAGGYASVRDLRRSLKPLGSRVRFWGHQVDVKAVYGQLDYLLTGLPEKEALGLNVIEAQACGTPVLAVRAPPFTETVVEGVTGLFYTDPRDDGGASFTQLINRISQHQFRIDPVAAQAHLAKFSEASFATRVNEALMNLPA